MTDINQDLIKHANIFDSLGESDGRGAQGTAFESEKRKQRQ